ncbi:methyltransferase domain-containing protein [Allonocardiopsis opalescens]|uniref:Methyltransferase family protein n=1 Tax=Allonocardiopsis opalescens TaxID=1144618 RepID=A0A2T0Q3U9_9ACTN|nr:methyltransferase domain-containing protein [Allonocardiopsis opalescens]PRX98472.1 methyltransferase family protein [Allonocardiopsis opalescens]
MTDRPVPTAPRAGRTTVLWEVLREALADLVGGAGPASGARRPLDIVDAGGGTGGAAVPLAELGHQVTVVEPSPDSLAALERRAAEAGVRVRGVQGDTADLAHLVPAGSADLVLVHNVLEYVDDPAVSLADIAGVVRPGGAVSLLVANAVAAVVHRAATGNLADAARLLADPDGTWGAGDPMPRRFTLAGCTALLEAAGLRAGAVHGVQVLADLVPARLVDGDAEALAALLDLERTAAVHPGLREIATQLHLLAHRPA